MESVLVEAFGGGEHQESFPLTHTFADNVYSREILLPAGSIVIGKIHRHGHINVITKGRVSVLTEFGEDEFVAPYTFVSKPGTKRVVYAHEDTSWITFHGTKHTDPERAEEEIICKNFAEFDALLQLGDKP